MQIDYRELARHLAEELIRIGAVSVPGQRVTINELRNIKKVSRRTIYNWIGKGLLPRPHTDPVSGNPYWERNEIEALDLRAITIKNDFDSTGSGSRAYHRKGGNR
jgi:hypothetical protein